MKTNLYSNNVKGLLNTKLLTLFITLLHTLTGEVLQTKCAVLR